MNKKIIIISILLLIFFILLVTNKSIAIEDTDKFNLGNNYKISGVVKDINGLPVQNCLVEVNSNACQTNEKGEFYFENLPKGDYSIKVFLENTQYKVDYIDRNSDKEYSLGKDTSICFLYPKNYQEYSTELINVVDKIVNKLKFISANNKFYRNIKMYGVEYDSVEDLEAATELVMKDSKSIKLIFTFAHNPSFIAQCKNKQTSLGVKPNIIISSPYKIISTYLGQDTSMLYNNFFESLSQNTTEEEIFDKIFNYYDNIKLITDRDERVEIDFVDNDTYVETEKLIIKNNHDNDATTNINIVLKEKNSEDSEENNNSDSETDEDSDVPNDIEQNNADIDGEGNVVLPPIEIYIDDDYNPETPPIVEQKQVSFKIEKKVSALKFVLPNGTDLVNEQGTINWSIGPDLKIIEMDKELMHGATINIEYEIRITNTGDVDLKNISIYDCLNYQYNNNFVYNPDETMLTDSTDKNSNYDWEIDNNTGSKNCIKTTVNELNVGSNVKIKLMLSRVISTEEDEMYYQNSTILKSLEYESQSEVINHITEEKIINDTLDGVIKSETILIIPPTGKK